MNSHDFRPLNIEKCELRQLAAADLAVGLVAEVIQTESLAVGQYCSPAPVVAAAVYEKAEGEFASFDVDLDGFISPHDVDLIVRHLAGNEGFGPIMPEGEETVNDPVDVNHDGVVSASDALVVINRVHFYNSLIPCTCGNCLTAAAFVEF